MKIKSFLCDFGLHLHHHVVTFFAFFVSVSLDQPSPTSFWSNQWTILASFAPILPSLQAQDAQQLSLILWLWSAVTVLDWVQTFCRVRFEILHICAHEPHFYSLQIWFGSEVRPDHFWNQQKRHTIPLICHSLFKARFGLLQDPPHFLRFHPDLLHKFHHLFKGIISSIC